MTTTHRVPEHGSGITPCCGRTPFELPRDDRMTDDRALVTCTGRAGELPSTATLDLDSPQLRAALEHTLNGTGTEAAYMAGKVLETLREHAS